ncbi:hypothetical protein ANN_03266 [Periplaneta americana]|uniref:Uncharacterized protein n=1 Tax=Periplaneta americana TaxID=6978 RepID=A0ABQ8TYI1_PERAM|nr:hypothetical protein ANN_03266 [Periplaneta americana]
MTEQKERIVETTHHIIAEKEEFPPLTREGHERTTTEIENDAQDKMQISDEESWTEARPRRRQQQPRSSGTLTGTGTEDNILKAAERKAWLFVGRLRQESTPESVKNFLSRKGIAEEIICEELPTRGSTKAFKVGIPFNTLETVNKDEFWPAGINVRRFRFFRRRGGARLD